ncbi:MAG: hypothetical protein EON98_01495 [Chitinophagaceae bacterium]|nr:MAG: hypothetical protein EON98_01495 [Chitinophagaceae bacterium]
MEFAELPHEEQVTRLYRSGVYVGKRKLGPTTVILYQLHGFYAEIYYLQYRRMIESISCFSGTARLDPYLSQVAIELLV